MAKQNKQQHKPAAATKKAPQTQRPAAFTSTSGEKKRGLKGINLPVPIIFFWLVWVWAAYWYGDVFHVAREYSFWAADDTLMRFENGVNMGWLWTIGRMLLMSFKWTSLGGLLVATMLGVGSWLLGYALRLPTKFRALQYVPAAIYMAVVSYSGFNTFFETETGRLLGIPAAVFALVAVAALIVGLITRKPLPHFVRVDKTERAAQSMITALLAILMVGGSFAISHFLRPEVRIVTSMQHSMEEQDWLAMQERAKKDDMVSYRQIAAYYAIALVQQGNLLNNLFDIRLDYDEPHMTGWSEGGNNGLNYYVQDCDYHAGLIETAIHHGMEQMTMNGPSIRTLKLLCKCALMRSEWEVAKKYLTILEHVPFEGDFTEKYKPMLYHSDLVNADKEMAKLRQLEPIHDLLENTLVQPAFLGYNARLLEGRSTDALYNSIAVSIYTKTMQDFMMRCQPLQTMGGSLPKAVGEALGVMSGKHPELMEQYQGLEFYRDHFASFIQNTRDYMTDRPKYAKELFPKYKGYYGYYYFFGNLKATKKRKENEGTSNQGVN